MPPYSQAEDDVRRLADEGVTLLAGTDAPNPGDRVRSRPHRELELLVRCGISPAQALATATTEPARLFGLADRRRVAARQRADLVLVSGNPLTDITATLAIERIWRAGQPAIDAPSSRALPKLSSLTLSTPKSPRSWQPCANAGPHRPEEGP